MATPIATTRLVYLTSARIPDDWGHVLQILNMCEAFAQEGARVELVAPLRANTPNVDPFTYAHMQPIFTITKLPCIDLFPGTQSKILYWVRILSFLCAARIYLLFKRYDVLYTREALAGILFRGFFYEAHSIPGRIASLARFIKHARGVIAITSFVGKRLVEAGIPQSKIMVAGDAVRLERFASMPERNAARAALGISPDQYIIGYSGTLKTMNQEKGVGATIRSLLELPESVHALIVGGEPEDVAEYRALAAELNLSSRATFIGKVPHARIPDYLAAFDVAVAPAPATEHSSYYGSPLKMFEYMAAGIPMIVSDLPALREVLTEETAVFIPPADPSALARAVLMLQGDPQRAKRLAEVARKDARQRFSWRARAHAILEFVKQC